AQPLFRRRELPARGRRRDFLPNTGGKRPTLAPEIELADTLNSRSCPTASAVAVNFPASLSAKRSVNGASSTKPSNAAKAPKTRGRQSCPRPGFAGALLPSE